MARKRRTPCGPNAADIAARLDRIYAQLPEIECRGKCWDSCGPIRMANVERQRIIAAGGPNIPEGTYSSAGGLCVALTILNRCGVYERRPMICRLWGLVESMPCTFGCRPEGGLLSDTDGYELLAQVLEVDGRHAEAAAMREPWATPERAAASSRFLREREADRLEAYEIRERLARANGGALYVQGRGRLSRSPGGAS